MQYINEILIEKPISEVIKKLESNDNLKHWKEGLVSAEHIYGVPSKIGAKTKLNYSYGKRKMEIIETITKQDLPNEFHLSYATKGIRNVQENYFETTQEGFTKWRSKNEFQPTNLKMSAMLFLMPSAFKKQTKSYMKNFKNFAEQGISVINSN